MALADQEPGDINDKAMLALCDDKDEEEDSSLLDDDVGGLALVPARTLAQVHQVALSVLRGELEHADIQRKFKVGIGGGQYVTVTLDRGVHSSGAQRGYVRCPLCGPNPWQHQACFNLVGGLGIGGSRPRGQD